jgi:hypothetical protein
MAIVTRAIKGSALSYGELDGNFIDLDSRTTVGWQNLNGDMNIAGIPSPPTMSVYQGVYLPSFDPDNIQECTVVFHMPHDYIPGTDIYPHGHFMSATNGTGTLRWGFTLSFANEGDAFTTPGTSYVEHTMTAGMKDVHHLVETPTPVSIPTLSYDSIVFMRVWRDATHVNDTYPDPIFLVQVDLYYQSQGFGTVAR